MKDFQPPTGEDEPQRRKRDLLWLFGPPTRRRGASRRAATTSPPTHQSAHPLRTEQWELAVHWRNATTVDHSPRRRSGASPLFVDFAANGYLRATPENRTGRRHGTGGYWMGQWEIAPSGLRCRLNETLLLHADLHLNPFGRHPRLTRGVIVDTARTGWRERRLVVGTFTGRGVGPDTVDLSYKRRR